MPQRHPSLSSQNNQRDACSFSTLRHFDADTSIRRTTMKALNKKNGDITIQQFFSYL